MPHPQVGGALVQRVRSATLRDCFLLDAGAFVTWTALKQRGARDDGAFGSAERRNHGICAVRKESVHELHGRFVFDLQVVHIRDVYGPIVLRTVGLHQVDLTHRHAGLAHTRLQMV